MKDIFITSRNRVPIDTTGYNATHVLSLVDWGKKVKLPVHFDKNNWKLINFRDELDKHISGGPTRHHVKQVLEWAKSLPEDAILLVHCEAGISRSSGMALAILIQEKGKDKIKECLATILEKRPIAMPNPVICEYADDYLELEGKLTKIGKDAWGI